PIRQLRQPFFLSAYPGEFFNVIVPGRDVLVPDGPVDGDPFPGMGLKIQVAPPVTLSSPHDGSSAHDIGTVPVKPLFFLVGSVHVVKPIAFVVLTVRVIPAEKRMALPLLHRESSPVF